MVTEVDFTKFLEVFLMQVLRVAVVLLYEPCCPVHSFCVYFYHQ